MGRRDAGILILIVVVFSSRSPRYIDRRDQAHLMAQGCNVAPPTVRTGAGFHRNNALRLGRQKGEKFNPRNLLPKRYRPISAGAVQLEHVLRQVHSDDVSLFHGRPLVL
jgi:hypothetical protein